MSSTPTIIINNKKFEKALTYKNLKSAIDKIAGNLYDEDEIASQSGDNSWLWDSLLKASGNLLNSNSSDSKEMKCFKKDERVSGTNKICTYNCMGSDVVINVKSTKICPLSIKK